MVKPFTHGAEHNVVVYVGHAIASTPAVRGFFSTFIYTVGLGDNTEKKSH